MTDDLIDIRTGELVESEAEKKVLEMLAIPDGLYGNPIGPADIEELIFQANEAVAHIARVILVLYERKHAAEQKYERAFAAAYERHVERGHNMANRLAKNAALAEQDEVNAAKEQLRYAEEMQEAVQQKSYGLMNVNKRFHGQRYSQ